MIVTKLLENVEELFFSLPIRYISGSERHRGQLQLLNTQSRVIINVHILARFQCKLQGIFLSDMYPVFLHLRSHMGANKDVVY